MSKNEADTRYHLIDPVVDVDTRTPRQIIEDIEARGRIVADALARLSALMTAAASPRDNLAASQTETREA